MLVPEVQALREKLVQAHEAIQSALAGISERELYPSPGEGEWSVGEVLAHVEEMQLQWIGKVRLMLGEEDPNVSRTKEEQERRLGFLREHSQDSLAQHQERLQEGRGHVLEAVSRLSVADLERRGHRDDGSSTTVGQMISQTICAHMEEHARQIRETRGKVAPAT